jgi:ArsR family transcriptional regulator
MYQDAVLDSEIFRALADPVRLRIVGFLLDQGGVCCAVPGRICACDIEAAVGLSQPAISHHMSILARTGLIRAEKIGRFVHYMLMPDRFAAASAFLADIAGRASARQAA